MKEDWIYIKDEEAIKFNIGCKDVSGQKLFNIYSFIKENSSLFAIIGINGTLLALLPNFLEKFIGSDWQQIFLSSDLGLFPLIILQIIILSGAFFILVITLQIIEHVFDNHQYEEILHSIGKYTYRTGDFNRILFLLFFIPTIGALIFFISAIFLFQKDITFIYSEVVIFCIFFIILFGFWIIDYILRSKSKSKTNKNFSLVIITIFLLLGILYYGSFLSSGFTRSTSGHTEIIYENQSYTALNSSDFGIELIVGGYAKNIGLLDPSYYRFHWTTSYGYFVVSDKNSTFYLNEGPELIYDPSLSKFNGYTIKTNGLKVYWAYDFRDFGIIKPQPVILLSIEDRRTNKPITSARINISWLDNDTAIVARD